MAVLVLLALGLDVEPHPGGRVPSETRAMLYSAEAKEGTDVGVRRRRKGSAQAEGRTPDCDETVTAAAVAWHATPSAAAARWSRGGCHGPGTQASSAFKVSRVKITMPLLLDATFEGGEG